MPAAPVLSKKQQKSSLSGKKTRSKETIRNVLASPYSNYWPLISMDDAEHLGTTLRDHLPVLVPRKVHIPLKELKKVPKPERKLFRQTYIENHRAINEQTEVGSRDGLILGVNDVTKGIENGNVRSVLITADVKPRLMVEHLIDQSVLMQIPVLVVPELRGLLKTACHLSSITIAFTDIVKYAAVQQAIEEIACKYPVPSNHIHFNRVTAASDSSVIIIDDSVVETTTSNLIDVEGGATKNTLSNKDDNSETDGIYLYRASTSERVFVPEKSCTELRNTSQVQVDSMGFLPFDVGSLPTPVTKYKSLVVKKIRGDLNRSKRKIESMKAKKKMGSNKKRNSKAKR